MARVVFYRNRRRARLNVAVGAVLLTAAVAFTTWALLNPDGLERAVDRSFQQRLVIALPFVLLFTPGILALVVFHGRRAADDRPLLVVDDSGVFYRDWHTGRLPWADVSEYQLIEVEESGGRGTSRKQWYLQLGIRNPERYLVARHGGGEFSEGYLRRYFRIPLKNIEAERDELLDAFGSRPPDKEPASV